MPETPVTLPHQTMEANHSTSNGNPWIQDPSALTTQQIQREIYSLQRIIETRLTGYDRAIDLLQRQADKEPSVSNVAQRVDALKEILETRLDGMDRALTVRMGLVELLKDTIQSSSGRLKELTDEKFTGVETQFIERDKRTDQTAKDTAKAVDAALQAAKEAVNAQQIANGMANNKMETSFTKQLDLLTTTITSLGKSLDDKITAGNQTLDGKINDNKTRIQAMESSHKGANDLWGYFVGGIGIVAAIITIAIRFH